MKVYITQNEINNDMLNIMTKDEKGKLILYAIIHNDFLHHEEFGGGEFNENSILNHISNGTQIEMDLTLVEDWE